uniref:Phosphoribosyltransferase domain-containing protein n=1 Tax=Ostreococcus mediterraneus TaxID=1486918 RepID=A0A6T5TAN1_9CHLO|mmetsp:Transcript_1052/g.3875  ORF Transcript_1052/g.3875 Transcript_1052/m.3875 type:complete len:478 (-) Transcript_1052:96-1529(-)
MAHANARAWMRCVSGETLTSRARARGATRGRGASARAGWGWTSRRANEDSVTTVRWNGAHGRGWKSSGDGSDGVLTSKVVARAVMDARGTDEGKTKSLAKAASGGMEPKPMTTQVSKSDKKAGAEAAKDVTKASSASASAGKAKRGGISRPGFSDETAWTRRRKFPVLFYSKEMEPLARKIESESDGMVELGEIDWRTFPDGFPDLFINDAYDVRDRHVAFLASFHSPEVIFEQLSIIYSLPKMFVASFTLVLPFFPTGTAERVVREGEVATAVTLARILSNIPPSRGGPTSTIIFDIHALQERFYFGDSILPCFESGIPLLLERLSQLEDANNVVIAYPDEGAYKRFHTFFASAGYESVVCTKVREGPKRIVKLKEGEPVGRHVVIVDDLVQSGSTLIECQKLLSRLGAVRVSAYATHGVFPNASWKRFTTEGAGGQGFANFWITDSCPQTVGAVDGVEPFEVLSLASAIAEALEV